MNDGWVNISRSAFYSKKWRGLNTGQQVLFITMLLTASHEKNTLNYKGKDYIVEPGEFITSSRSLAEESGLSRQSVRTALKKLSEYKLIEVESLKVCSKVKILNWLKYHSNEELDKNSREIDEELKSLWI